MKKYFCFIGATLVASILTLIKLNTPAPIFVLALSVTVLGGVLVVIIGLLSKFVVIRD